MPEPPGDGPHVHTGRDQLRCGVVPERVQVSGNVEPRGHPAETLGGRGGHERRAAIRVQREDVAVRRWRQPQCRCALLAARQLVPEHLNRLGVQATRRCWCVFVSFSRSFSASSTYRALEALPRRCSGLPRTTAARTVRCAWRRSSSPPRRTTPSPDPSTPPRPGGPPRAPTAGVDRAAASPVFRPGPPG